MASLLIKEKYDNLQTVENNGSKAAVFPILDYILWQLKSEESNAAAGFKKTNVKEIIGLRAQHHQLAPMYYWRTSTIMEKRSPGHSHQT